MFLRTSLLVLLLLNVHFVNSGQVDCISGIIQVFQNESKKNHQQSNGYLNNLIIGDEKQSIGPWALVQQITALELLDIDSCHIGVESIFPMSSECKQALWDASSQLNKVLQSADNPFMFAISLSVLQLTLQNAVQQQCRQLNGIIDIKSLTSPQCIKNMVDMILSANNLLNKSYDEKYSFVKQKSISTLSSCGQKTFAEKIQNHIKGQCQKSIIILFKEVRQIKKNIQKLNNREFLLQQLLKSVYQKCSI